MPDPGGDFAATSRWNSRRDVQMPRGTGADVLAGWEAHCPGRTSNRVVKRGRDDLRPSVVPVQELRRAVRRADRLDIWSHRILVVCDVFAWLTGALCPIL